MSIHQKILKYNKVNRIELQNFGLLIGGILFFVFYVLIPFILIKPVVFWPLGICGYFFFFSFFLQENLRWIYVPWMLMVEVLGWINTRIIFGVFYFAIITPVGCCMRVMGKDILKLKFEKKRSSYRVKQDDIDVSPFGF